MALVFFLNMDLAEGNSRSLATLEPGTSANDADKADSSEWLSSDNLNEEVNPSFRQETKTLLDDGWSRLVEPDSLCC